MTLKMFIARRLIAAMLLVLCAAFPTVGSAVSFLGCSTTSCSTGPGGAATTTTRTREDHHHEDDRREQQHAAPGVDPKNEPDNFSNNNCFDRVGNGCAGYLERAFGAGRPENLHGGSFASLLVPPGGGANLGKSPLLRLKWKGGRARATFRRDLAILKKAVEEYDADVADFFTERQQSGCCSLSASATKDLYGKWGLGVGAQRYQFDENVYMKVLERKINEEKTTLFGKQKRSEIFGMCSGDGGRENRSDQTSWRGWGEADIPEKEEDPEQEIEDALEDMAVRRAILEEELEDVERNLEHVFMIEATRQTLLARQKELRRQIAKHTVSGASTSTPALGAAAGSSSSSAAPPAHGGDVGAGEFASEALSSTLALRRGAVALPCVEALLPACAVACGRRYWLCYADHGAALLHEKPRVERLFRDAGFRRGRPLAKVYEWFVERHALMPGFLTGGLEANCTVPGVAGGLGPGEAREIMYEWPRDWELVRARGLVQVAEEFAEETAAELEKEENAYFGERRPWTGRGGSEDDDGTFAPTSSCACQ